MTARYESPLLSCCASEYMPRLFFSDFYITDNPNFVSYRNALTYLRSELLAVLANFFDFAEKYTDEESAAINL